MQRLRQADGFQLVSGVLGVAIGPVLLARGAPAGWSFLLMAAGLMVLLAQWAIVSDVTFEIAEASQIALAAVGVVCVGVAVVYLTRAADDVPRLLPFHDADSENFQLVPGFVALAVGLAALGRAIATTHPSRPHH
jgi:hypothetical protein